MEKAEWRFGVVGNIISEHIGEGGNAYYGTKAFSPGTKVYIYGKNWNPDIKDIAVIGINRFGRMVLEYIPIRLRENVRKQRIYHPLVLKIINATPTYNGWEWWDTLWLIEKKLKRL